MLPLKSTFISRSIAHREVVKIAKETQEHVLYDTPEYAQQSGSFEHLVDTMFFNGIKKKAVSQIRDLSYHTASLHLELEKPEPSRSHDSVGTHEREISRSKNTLSELTPGEALEFGTEQGRAVVGRESYLVHRSESRICPTGLPLYGPEERGGSIPTFRAVEDIRACDIQQIRTRRDGMIRCNGVIYKVEFDIRNQPKVLVNKLNSESGLLQSRLHELWNSDQVQFALNPTSQTTNIHSSTWSDSGAGVFGIDEERDPEPNLVIRPVPMPGGLQPAPEIPTFENDGYINVDHFEAIEAAKQLICNNKLIRVRFDSSREPIVLQERYGLCLKAIELRLFKIWIVVSASDTLRELRKIESDDNLQIAIPFPDTESEQFGLRAQYSLDTIWEQARDTSSEVFKHCVKSFSSEIEKQKAKLKTTLEDLMNEKRSIRQLRATLNHAKSYLPTLVREQTRFNTFIREFKSAYQTLFQFASASTNVAMQEVLLNRISNFDKVLNDVCSTTMKGVALSPMHSALQSQKVFIEKFPGIAGRLNDLLVGAEPIALCDHTTTASPLTPIILETVTKPLHALLSDLTSSWETIQSEMDRVRQEKSNITRLFTFKLNRGIKLNQKIQTFMGQNGKGIDPVTEQSFYTPKTQARLVTVLKIQKELSNNTTLLSEATITDLLRECDEHLPHILRETLAMNTAAQSEQFTGYNMYQFERLTNGEPMDFHQWSDDQKAKVME